MVLMRIAGKKNNPVFVNAKNLVSNPFIITRISRRIHSGAGLFGVGIAIFIFLYCCYGLAQQNRYVGSHTCSKCHAENFELWKMSAHARPILPVIRSQKACYGCHTTGMVFEEDLPIELDVGCEECHGPGWRHLREPQKATLINPARLPYQSGNDVCLACHSRGYAMKRQKSWPEGFQPGNDLSAFWQLFRYRRGQESEFFSRAGFARRANMQGNEYLHSKKWLKEVSCFSCHVAHGSEYLGSLVRDASQSNALCVTCHNKETGLPPMVKNLSEHTHHDPVGRGSICIECHLPLMKRIESDAEKRAHHFSFELKSDDRDIPLAPHNACLRCHTDQSLEWSINLVNRWRQEKISNNNSHGTQ